MSWDRVQLLRTVMFLTIKWVDGRCMCRNFFLRRKWRGVCKSKWDECMAMKNIETLCFHVCIKYPFMYSTWTFFFYYHYFVIKINVLVLRVFHSCRGSISQVFREMLPVVVLNRTHDSDHTGKVGCRMVCFLTAQLKRGTVLSNSVLFGRLTGDYDWKCSVASFCTFIFFHCLRVRKLTWG